MSKNLTIDEGGESRHFDGVRRLKTKLMGENAGTCYWVPDDETRAWPTFIMNNGMHSAEEEGVYGFTEAMVNVYIPSPNPDWKIIIDDIDIPHIIIEDIDIDIDDIDIHIDDIDISIDDIDGTPIVDIEGIDLDGIEIPNIDIHMDDDGLPISDIDFKTDIHVWTDEDDPTKIHIKEEPNGEEIVLDYDDIDGTVTFKDLLDIRYDDTVIDEEKWVIEAHTKIKVDGVEYEAGDEIKSWDKDEIVDFTMKVEQVISVDFPDIDPDFGEDFDIELDLDNMELDMDGLDMDIDLPLLKMPDLDDELPDEIRIMHVPDKTSYKDGEAIDLDGIVVQAYKNGTVWRNKKYINGYIPAHELSIEPSIAEFDDSQKESDLGVTVACNDQPISAIYTGTRYSNSYHSGQPYTFEQDNSVSIDRVIGGKAFATKVKETYKWNGQIVETYDGISGWIAWDKYLQQAGTSSFTHNDKTVAYRGPFALGNDNLSVLDSEHNIFVSVSCEYSAPQNGYRADLPSIGELAWTAVFGETKESSSSDITVSWPRPVDGLALTASFQISVEPAEDTTPAGN